MNVLTTKRLIELGETKLHLLTELKHLAIEQTSLVMDQRADELLSVLSKKSDILDSLKQLQQQLQPYQQQKPEDRRWATEKDRDVAREMFQSIDRLLAELMMMENHALNEMNQQRDSISGQLSAVANAHTVHKAYDSVSHSEYDNDNLGFSVNG